MALKLSMELLFTNLWISDRNTTKTKISAITIIVIEVYGAIALNKLVEDGSDIWFTSWF
jgi:hypothetical protein